MANLNPGAFLKEVRSELSQVVWPTRKETVRMTLVVIGVSLVVGLFLGTIDFLLTKIIEVVLKK